MILSLKTQKRKMSTFKIIDLNEQLTINEIAAMSGDNAKGVSICIPRIFRNINAYRIKKSFIALDWGYVERVDVISSGKTNRAFVHYRPGQFNASKVLSALCDGNEVKVIYGEPWFWKLSLSRSPKPQEAPKERPRPQFEVLGGGRGRRGGRKLTIDITDDPIAARQAENISSNPIERL